jgi:hypothetical protein
LGFSVLEFVGADPEDLGASSFLAPVLELLLDEDLFELLLVGGAVDLLFDLLVFDVFGAGLVVAASV